MYKFRQMDSIGTYKAVIFDLDGVVVDTAKYHYLAWKRLAKLFNFELTDKDNEKFKGVNRLACMDLLVSMAGLALSQEQKIKLADMKNNWYIEYISNMNEEEILPGFIDFISDIRKKGSKTAIASASKNAGIVLERLNIRDYFDVVVDGNDVKRSKPDPQVFEIAADRLDIAASMCIVFEDSQAGIDAAKMAGMSCVGIGDSSSLIGADVVVTGFTDSRLSEYITKKI